MKLNDGSENEQTSKHEQTRRRSSRIPGAESSRYDGKVDGHFPLKEFRKCADYLAGVLQNANLDAEDIRDVVRVALSRREKAAGV